MTPSTAKAARRAGQKAAPQGKADEAATQQRKAGRRPAYLQTKLAMSRAGDPSEQEADRVADQVASATVKAPGEHSELQRDTADGTVPAARTIARAAQRPEGEQASRRADHEGGEIDRETREADEPAALTRAKGEHAGADTETAPRDQIDAATERRIESLRGTGSPLPERVRHDMQDRLGADLSAVRVHTGSEAAALCNRLNARAFTVGNDIFFAPGEFAPMTEGGRRLLAHELTHVIQQSGGVERRVQRDEDQEGNSTTRDTGVGPRGNDGFGEKRKGFLELPRLAVPTEMVSEYNALAPLILHKNYSRPRDDQRDVWRANIATSATEDWLKKAMKTPATHREYIFEVPSQYAAPEPGGPAGRNTELLIGSTLTDVARQAAIPKWDHDGSPHKSQTEGNKSAGSYDVDHIVEQRFGAQVPTGEFKFRDDDIHTMDNFLLLDGNINRHIKVKKLNESIDNALDDFKKDNQEVYQSKPLNEWSNQALKAHLSLKFLQAEAGPTIGASGNNVWEKDAINSGKHIQALNPAADATGPGGARIFYRTREEIDRSLGAEEILVLYSETRGMSKVVSSSASTNTELLKPFELIKVDTTEPDDLVRFNVRIPDANGIGLKPRTLAGSFAVKSFRGSSRIGMIPTPPWHAVADLKKVASGEKATSSVLEYQGLSPISVDHWSMDPETGLIITGQIFPTLPLIQGTGIDFRIAGDTITFSKTFIADDLDVPEPFSVDAAAVTLWAGTEGIGAYGTIDYTLEGLGNGSAEAAFQSGPGLSLAGDLAFDERLFGRGNNARINFDYRDGAWAIGGQVTIPRGKLPGIRSATIEANYSETEGFSASGEAELAIPGVERGTLDITHTQEQGLAIGGSFELSADTPGIRSGALSAEVQERAEGDSYALTARGEAVPDLPGFDSRLQVAYDDGAITAEAEAHYQRGMLDGTINAGATNRALDEQGNPTGETTDEITVFGGGEVTIQIAPWLEGTAGIEFEPNGEVTVRGEIGLPDQIEIFPRKEIDKRIFGLSVQAPIVPGIVAEIGGGLSAEAGIGPGAIDELRLGVEYNPADEENTHVAGDALLKVPADAGLRLSARAGIGLGITGASATGGLEVGGTLGVEGAAEAGVQIDWMPSKGLELNAQVAVQAQPSFTFDISGYVSVTVLGGEVYGERWELASFTYGSDYRFGIRLPVTYTAGEPFDLSLDDVEFEVPDIDTHRLLRGLVEEIAS